LRKLEDTGNDQGDEPMKNALRLMLLVSSYPALAHDGHGLGSPLLHALDHGLLILAGAVVLGAGTLGLRALRRARRAARPAAESAEHK
jgi:hypothetical protein